MAGDSHQRPPGAAVVVRAWIEASAGHAALRVRVVEVGAAPGEERTLCVTADPAEAADAVRRWLEQLVR